MIVALSLFAQPLKDISVFCDKVMVLHKGSSIFFGEPEKGIEIFYKLDRQDGGNEAMAISRSLQGETDYAAVEYHSNPLKQEDDAERSEDLGLEVKNELFGPSITMRICRQI